MGFAGSYGIRLPSKYASIDMHFGHIFGILHVHSFVVARA